jgi:hypothetical protein
MRRVFGARGGYGPDECTGSTARAFVAKLQRPPNRSSASHPVDKPVNMRWKVLAYTADRRADGCFCCRFSTPLLCIKKRLPSAHHPTMLGAHQALQHKM